MLAGEERWRQIIWTDSSCNRHFCVEEGRGEIFFFFFFFGEIVGCLICLFNFVAAPNAGGHGRREGEADHHGRAERSNAGEGESCALPGGVFCAHFSRTEKKCDNLRCCSLYDDYPAGLSAIVQNIKCDVNVYDMFPSAIVTFKVPSGSGSRHNSEKETRLPFLVRCWKGTFF